MSLAFNRSVAIARDPAGLLGNWGQRGSDREWTTNAQMTAVSAPACAAEGLRPQGTAVGSAAIDRGPPGGDGWGPGLASSLLGELVVSKSRSVVLLAARWPRSERARRPWGMDRVEMDRVENVLGRGWPADNHYSSDPSTRGLWGTCLHWLPVASAAHLPAAMPALPSPGP